MNFIFSDNVRILCLSCNVKKVGKLTSGEAIIFHCRSADLIRVGLQYRLKLEFLIINTDLDGVA
jgi:hypothetical protein